MNDIELCQQLLGLKAPWKVTQVKVSHSDQRMDIQVVHAPETPFACPTCGQACPVYDHAPARRWRHLDAFQFHTYLHADPPRIQCDEHGVKTAELPWAAPGARFTEMFEIRVIDTLQDLQSITSCCKILDITWDQAYAVMQRAVERGLSRREIGTLTHIGVDEKAWRKGHSYVTILADLKQKTVVDIAPERTIQSLNSLYTALPQGSLDQVEAVAMDMWPAFSTATAKRIDNAQDKIVHDRFHCVQLLLKALNKVRAKEARLLKQRNDLRLVGAKYAVGKNPDNLTVKQRAKLDTILDADLLTGQAWAFKENCRNLWESSSLTEARKKFDHWYKEVDQSGIKPMIEVARAFKIRLPQILNWFKHRVSTGIVEAINGKIMTIKRRARGHRNYQNLRTAILFFLGGLDLTLRSPNPPLAGATH